MLPSGSTGGFIVFPGRQVVAYQLSLLHAFSEGTGQQNYCLTSNKQPGPVIIGPAALQSGPGQVFPLSAAFVLKMLPALLRVKVQG